MKKRFISIFCMGAMILGLAGCKSDSVSSTGTGAGGAATGGTTAATTQTDIAEVPEFEMIIANEPITTTTERIRFVVRYNGDDPDMTLNWGDRSLLEKLGDDGSWYNADPDAQFNLVAYSTENSEFSGGYDLKHISEPLTAGTYRLTKEINDGIVVMTQFEMTEGSAAEQTTATTTAVIATEPLPPDAPEYTMTSGAYIPDEPQDIDAPDYPDFVEPVPLAEYDIMLEIADGYTLTSDMDSFRVDLTYIGAAENAEYCFGSSYTLKYWDNDLGDWAVVPFGENSAFDALGHLIGSNCPHNSITVSLNDDFYAEPLEAGSYLVEIEIDGITFNVVFDYKHTDDATGYIIESSEGAVTLTITEIKDDRLVCQLPWPYPAVYEVMCDTSEYDELCVNDTIEVTYAPMYKIEDMFYRLIPTDIEMSDFELQEGADYKPVIYLYPEAETDVSVKLDYNGKLTVTDPYYGDGWSVTASPDGTLTTADGSVYPYLFWEGERDFEYDLTEGFCVKGEDTAAFLSEKLSYLGLSDSEKAEFCEFWLPHMEKNEYNIITFRGEDYTDNAVLDIDPLPDTVIRVFMTYAPSDEYVEIASQELSQAPERSGFTVVEWGGAVLSLN